MMIALNRYHHDAANTTSFSLNVLQIWIELSVEASFTRMIPKS